MSRIATGLRWFRRALQRMKPHQWIEKNIVLPAGANETKSGPVDFSHSPYLRDIVDDVRTPGITDVVFVAPTRLGKTFTIRCWWAYIIGEDQSPILLYDSTLTKAATLSKKELQPLVEANEVLRSRKPKNRHHYTNSLMLFLGAPFTAFGAKSVSGAAGETARVLLNNEVDKWDGEKGVEASMIELVRHRTESFENDRKHLSSSTPTTEAGPIWQEFLKGDQRKFFVPCQCCGVMQELVWEQVRWDETAKNEDGSWDMHRVRKSAHYLAPCCGAKWNDAQRVAAVRDSRSEWRATAKARLPGYRSYHINGLYGPLVDNDMGALAVSFLDSRTSAFFNDRRDFWNSRMGLPWRDTVTTFDGARIRQRIEDYERGTLPSGFKADVIIIEYDVQTYGFPWVVHGYAWNGECRTIDHGLAASFADIDSVQTTYAPLAPLSYVIGDINFEARRAECLEAVFMRQSRGWLLADGQPHTREPVKMGSMNPFLGSNKGYQAANASIPRLLISTYDFKCEWEKRFTGEISNWRTYSVKPDAPKRDHDEQAEYFAQLLDERRVPRKRRLIGQPEWEWKSRSGNNHAFDCHVYGLALFWLLSRARTAAEKAAASTPPPASASAPRRTATVTRR